MEVSGQLHAPATLSPRKRIPGAHCIRGWVGHKAGLDTGEDRKISCPFQESNAGPPARSLSLYRLWTEFNVADLRKQKYVKFNVRQLQSLHTYVKAQNNLLLHFVEYEATTNVKTF
jgi:hypothetical protein